MPPLAKKKPSAPKAPKKPTSKSKTGNAECSSAASNWQLALRGKAPLEAGTHKTLAKCRALVASKKGAGLREASGKYSEQGRIALESRLQKRFDSDLVTAKSRREKLEKLLTWRKGMDDKIKSQQESGDTKGLQITGGMRSAGFDAAQRRESRAQATGMTPEERAKTALRTSSTLMSRRSALEGQKRGMGANVLVDNASIGVRQANSGIEKLRAARKAREAEKPVEKQWATIEKRSITEQREESNRAEFSERHKLKRPMVGPTGAKIVGYQWVNQTVEGMYRDRKVSDWSNAQTSVPTGRSIVHLFLVEGKDGKQTLMGRGAAQKALGISESRIVTIAKKEADRQKWEASESKRRSDEYEKIGESSPKMAIGRWISNPTHQKIGGVPRVAFKNGKYVATINPHTISELKDNGWSVMAEGRGTSFREQKAQMLIKSRLAKAKPAPAPAPAKAAVPTRPKFDDSWLSPSGKVSKRFREQTDKKAAEAIFGPGGMKAPQVKQPTEQEALRQQAGELRDLASRGMKPRAYKKKADELEARAAMLDKPAPAPAKPPAPPKYSLGGKLAPGRGTSDRQDVADKLKMVRRTAKTSMHVAEHLRPTRYVDKYGGGSGIMIPEPFDANQARKEVYSRMNLTRDYEQARRKARTLTRKANKLAR